MQKSSIVKVVKKVIPAVVSITVSKYLTIFENPFGLLFPGSEEFFAIPKGRKKVKIGGGSGFIIDSDGIILTNRHVIADPEAEYIVLLNEEERYKAKILAKNSINDVAILKINKKNLPILELGDSSTLELGQTAIAIGNALGIFRNTVSVGVVSGLSRKIVAGEPFQKERIRLRGLIQTDAAVNPGNSGGPLIDIQGKVIGINAVMVLLAENIGFALPINTAKKDLKDIKKYGRIRQPFLGIRYVLLNERLQKLYNLPTNEGALVTTDPSLGEEAVISGSPADKTGIKELDIILEAQKEKITPQNTLEDVLQKYKVGDEIELKILRQGKKKLYKTILGERK